MQTSSLGTFKSSLLGIKIELSGTAAVQQVHTYAHTKSQITFLFEKVYLASWLMEMEDVTLTS